MDKSFKFIGRLVISIKNVLNINKFIIPKGDIIETVIINRHRIIDKIFIEIIESNDDNKKNNCKHCI